MIPPNRFTIRREQLNHLPEIHRLVAELLIRDGQWILVEGSGCQWKKRGEQ